MVSAAVLSAAAALCSARAATLPASWKEKVDARLLAAPAGASQDVLIVLAEQADLSAARSLASKAEKGRYVFERLNEAARRTQQPLIRWLQSQGAQPEPYWVANMIRAQVGPVSLESVARRPEVARVERNPAMRARLADPAPRRRRGGPANGRHAVEPRSAGSSGPLGGRVHGPGRRHRRRRHGDRVGPSRVEAPVPRMERNVRQPQLQLARRRPQRRERELLRLEPDGTLRRRRPRNADDRGRGRRRRREQPRGDGPGGALDRLPKHGRRDRDAREVRWSASSGFSHRRIWRGPTPIPASRPT